MIELIGDELVVSFRDVHQDARNRVSFQRTLRVPDDNQDYPLPAGLGRFPLRFVDDHPVPEHWKNHGGVFLPMYQSEALWICLEGSYPMAVKIAAGKINAVTGQPWSNTLTAVPQDYVVMREQPWLDGFCASPGVVRQFVAMPLGEGYTAEEQITDEAEWGGLQLIFYPMKAEEYRRRFEVEHDHLKLLDFDLSAPAFCRVQAEEMGLAPGGRIRQVIEEDPYGLDIWDTSVSSRCYVHMLNSQAYSRIAREVPPTQPITPSQYAAAGIPWFEHYSDGQSIPGSSILASLAGIATKHLQKGKRVPDNMPIAIANTIMLNMPERAVRDGAY
jgi:hypothetical protein